MREELLRSNAATKLTAELGEPTERRRTRVVDLDTSGYGGQTWMAVRAAAEVAVRSGDQRVVEILVWEERCRDEIREGIVAVIDSESGQLVAIEASTAVGERPLVVVRSKAEPGPTD